MKIVFSRKGFDSTAGRAPSPIEGGHAISLPIPAADRSATRYRDLGHGRRVETATRGRIAGRAFCHDDPMFAGGLCWFGQCGAAQGHLAKQGVTPGDVFVFFGLFADPGTGERHHRIFGWMEVACHGPPDEVVRSPRWTAPPRAHPHFLGDWPAPNQLWHGPGATDAPRRTRRCGSQSPAARSTCGVCRHGCLNAASRITRSPNAGGATTCSTAQSAGRNSCATQASAATRGHGWRR